MDYQKIYNQIIERAQEQHSVRCSQKKAKTTYYENHHIIPKCLGGSNLKSNLVMLSVKEHRVSHACLHFINPSHSGLALAYIKMYYGNRWQHRDTKIPLRLYESARTLAYDTCRNKRLGKTYEEIMGPKKAIAKRIQHSKAMTGRRKTEDTILKLKQPKPKGFGKKVSQALKGRIYSDDTLLKMRKQAKEVNQYGLDGNFIRHWPSKRLAANSLGINSSNLAKACRENRILKGFRWKYKN